MTSKFDLWLIVGFAGQILFSMRFLIQWLKSEKEQRSVIPISFWYFSLGGSFLLLAYALHRQDPVFIVGQSMGFIIYIRNLILIDKQKKKIENLEEQNEKNLS